uniref:Uncharacterized protein n=1 Tax=Anopheles merus TaxID=30066 RepID=A0A182UTQ2_ANOME
MAYMQQQGSSSSQDESRVPITILGCSTSVSSVTENSWSLWGYGTGCARWPTVVVTVRFDRRSGPMPSLVLPVLLTPLALIRFATEADGGAERDDLWQQRTAVHRPAPPSPVPPQQQQQQQIRWLTLPASRFIEARNPLCHQA